MQFPLFAILTYVLFALQSTAAAELAIGGFTPQFVWGALFVWGSRFPRAKGVILAALWGLLSDALAGGRLGPNLIGFVAAVLVLQHLRSMRFLLTPVAIALISLPSVFLTQMIAGCFQYWIEGVKFAPVALTVHSAGEALYTACIIGIAASLRDLFSGNQNISLTPAAPQITQSWRMLTD